MGADITRQAAGLRRDQLLGQVKIRIGFPARGLNLATYQGISSGITDPATGKRRSVFAPGPDGKTPLLIAALMARHAEVAGQPVPGVRGMPLGLPPMPLEDIQRVITWVAQGRPR